MTIIVFTVPEGFDSQLDSSNMNTVLQTFFQCISIQQKFQLYLR